MGILIDVTANGFVDNESVVFNSTTPSSCFLKTKHNATNYHKTWELVAHGVMRIFHEPGISNPSDALNKKAVSGPHHKKRRLCHKSFTKVGFASVPQKWISSAWEDWGFGALHAFPR